MPNYQIAPEELLLWGGKQCKAGEKFPGKYF